MIEAEYMNKLLASGQKILPSLLIQTKLKTKFT